MIDEYEQHPYSPDEIALLSDTRQYYGRLLNTRTREYAIDNATCNISKVIRYFELNRDGVKSVLDIGCGLGMQSIIFAARGARVVGIDLNPHCIRLCNKRKRYYEELLQIDLDKVSQFGSKETSKSCFHVRACSEQNCTS